ncbi:hypothetical protein ACPXA0_25855, partial [Escherichia coli]|uniref:hypothetical protein n=1 Tax=Escherichia coli TaxID=562 RepID=UPI003CE52046
KEIEILIRAKYPILALVSWEERRVEEAIAGICRSLNRKLYTWSLTQGMRPEAGKRGDLPPALEALAQVREAPEFTVFLLKDFHPYMKDP